METRDDSFLLRSQKPSRALTPSPLKGLVQWCVMEPLLADECLRHVSSVDFKGDELVSKLRVEYSKLHADVLAGLLSFSSSASTVNLLSIDDVIGLVANVLDFSRAFCVKAECVEKSVERFAQLLQAGLSVGIIQPKIGQEINSVMHTCDYMECGQGTGSYIDYLSCIPKLVNVHVLLKWKIFV